MEELLRSAQMWVDDLTYSATAASPTARRATPRAPTAPAALSATDTPSDAGGSIDLSWAAATDNVGVTGYKLYRGTAAGIYGAPTRSVTSRATPTPCRRPLRRRWTRMAWRVGSFVAEVYHDASLDAAWWTGPVDLLGAGAHIPVRLLIQRH